MLDDIMFIEGNVCYESTFEVEVEYIGPDGGKHKVRGKHPQPGRKLGIGYPAKVEVKHDINNHMNFTADGYSTDP